MKKFLLGTVALVALGALPAFAADLGARPYYTKAPPNPAPMYSSWSAFYIGAHLGGAFSSSNNFNGLVSGNNNDGRLLGGLQAGADYQFATNWVVGIEGQYSWLGNNNSVIFPGGFIYSNNQRALGSVTGRLGFAWGPALLYAKASPAHRSRSRSIAVIVMATPSAPGWNTCSLRAGRPKSSTSITTSATPALSAQLLSRRSAASATTTTL